MDVAAIEPGRDFRKAIDQSIANCNVLLAIIGLEWLEAKDATEEAAASTTRTTLCGLNWLRHLCAIYL